MRAARWPAPTFTTLDATIMPIMATITSSSIKVNALRMRAGNQLPLDFLVVSLRMSSSLPNSISGPAEMIT